MPRHTPAILGCALLALALFPSCQNLPDALRPSFLNSNNDSEDVPTSPNKAFRVQRSIVDGKICIELKDFDEVSAEQKESDWCWAACAQMIAHYNGVTDVTQKDIAARIHGHHADGTQKVAAASRFEVFRALAPDAPQSEFEAVWKGALEGQAVEASESLAKGGDPSLGVREDQVVDAALEQFVPRTSIPIDELALGHPAVVGLREDRDSDMGHIYVLVGATYKDKGIDPVDALGKVVGGIFNIDAAPAMKRAGFSKYDVSELVLIDPWIDDDESTEVNEMRRVMPFDEFVEVVDFISTESDARTALTRWGKFAEVK